MSKREFDENWSRYPMRSILLLPELNLIIVSLFLVRLCVPSSRPISKWWTWTLTVSKLRKDQFANCSSLSLAAGVIGVEEFRYNCIQRIATDDIKVVDEAFNNLLNVSFPIYLAQVNFARQLRSTIGKVSAASGLRKFLFEVWDWTLKCTKSFSAV